MSDLLTRYNWNTNEYTPMPGTEGWVVVAELGEGGYEWCQFNAFYSPSARRYFWHGDRGCSCNSWSDDLSSASDFEDGDRGALMRAWESFAKENEYSIHATDYLDGVSEINKFTESTK
jgi:hypothetical protein